MHSPFKQGWNKKDRFLNRKSEWYTRRSGVFMKIDVNIITGRTIDQGANIENKLSEDYFQSCARCEVGAEDLKALGVPEGSNVKVSTDFGSVVIPVFLSEGNPKGIAFIPMGPWANAVVNPDTHGCGMPGFKGVPATLEPTDEKPLDLKKLINSYKE
jgi:formylmethanofuran dehydrogenase subunit D